MRRILQAVLIVMVVLSGIVLYNVLREAQWAHSWIKSAFALLPEVGTIIAVVELQHSEKANDLRDERNRLAATNNELQAERNGLASRNIELERQLQTERNEHLAEIAKQMQRPETVAEQNAAKLRRHLGQSVVVFNGDDSRWPSTPSIAEVSESNVVALFQPMDRGSQASVIYANAGDVEIIEVPRGACPLQVKVIKRYGNPIQLGEITKWEDRKTVVAEPVFQRGEASYHARFTRQGSPDHRTLYVYSSQDGSNSFLLEASTGERFVGDNKAVSVRFLSQQVTYRSEGFQIAAARSGPAPFPLFIS